MKHNIKQYFFIIFIYFIKVLPNYIQYNTIYKIHFIVKLLKKYFFLLVSLYISLYIIAQEIHMHQFQVAILLYKIHSTNLTGNKYKSQYLLTIKSIFNTIQHIRFFFVTYQNKIVFIFF